MKITPKPVVGEGEVLVATRASLISAGTEKMVMEFAGKSLAGKAKARPDLVKKVWGKLKRDGLKATISGVFGRLEEPLPLGYSAAGVVVAVGSRLAHAYAVGDGVAMAGAGLANHAHFNAVPKNLVAKMPEGVPFEHACYATLASIALQGVRNAGVTLGDNVLVVGLGLVGQLAVQLAAAAGARVAGFDPNKARGDLALKGGAEMAVSGGNAAAAFADFTGGRGFDSVLICAATDSDGPVAEAAAWARDRATVVLVGKVGTAFPYAEYMKKELTVKTSRSYGPGRYDPVFEQGGVAYPAGYVPHTEADHLREVLHLMSTGQLDVGLLTTHAFAFDDALKAYDLLKKNTPTLGVVLIYPEAAPAEAPRPALALKRDEIGVGLLGPGAFARGTLLPLLARTEGVKIAGIAGKGGLTAAHAAEKFGGFAASGEDALLKDKATHAVVIATRHSAHAAQVGAALKAGKHVWVEKPLCLSVKDLEKIEQVQRDNPQVLMIGFNRRFAPNILDLKKKFSGLKGAKQVLIRVNAGRLDDGNWQSGAEGGGRLLGEVCHFSDLALFLTGSPVQSISATAGKGQDCYSLTLRHRDGSLSSIVYTSEGDPEKAKEYIEMHGGGRSGVVKNYATGWLGGADKGHAAALKAFIEACRGFAPAPVPVAELLHSSRVILAAAESLKTGEPVLLRA